MVRQARTASGSRIQWRGWRAHLAYSFEPGRPLHLGDGDGDAACCRARSRDHSHELALQWRQLTRIATIVALFTSPAVYAWLRIEAGWSTWLSLLCAAIAVLMFRGLLEVIFRRFIPWPTLFGADAPVPRGGHHGPQARLVLAHEVLPPDGVRHDRGPVLPVHRGLQGPLPGPGSTIEQTFIQQIRRCWYSRSLPGQLRHLLRAVPADGVSQIRSYEPGDADWGVNLDDVRGQAEAKEEVRRVVTLWQSGEAFEQAGGKRERGLLMLGAPAPARRCSPRRSPPGSTARSCRSRGRGSPGCSSAWTRSRCGSWPGGQEARAQVGRPVHRLHRRDRRRRHAPGEPRGGLVRVPGRRPWRTCASTAATAR